MSCSFKNENNDFELKISHFSDKIAIFRSSRFSRLKSLWGKNYPITVQWIRLNFWMWLHNVTRQNMTQPDFWINVCSFAEPRKKIRKIAAFLRDSAKKTLSHGRCNPTWVVIPISVGIKEVRISLQLVCIEIIEVSYAPRKIKHIIIIKIK